jgi:nucleotide-binding universal stress UspA family protein
LLYAVEPINPGIYEVSLSVIEDAQARALEFGREYIAGMVEKLKTSGFEVNAEVVRGKAADAILEYAKNNSVDMIAMTTHGRSGVSRWVMGSVAERVVRGSAVPVLLVTPPGCRIQE